jgi:predicted MPP superfamily phosphohydrolase
MKKYFVIICLGLIGTAIFAQHPEATFMVFSDPHYYDPSLGIEGEAFQHYLDSDRKLLKESKELIETASASIIEQQPDFLIIPGDLTKDGTLVSHSEFANLLHKIEAERIKVFVVPGNHDVSNGESNSFQGDKKVLVENVSPSGYEEIFQEFGFSEAIFRDEHSLSYVAEPAEGIWFFGLDACQYKKNEAHLHPITDGEFSKETLQWIEEKALLGKKEGKTMIAAMHHGILEHYKGQEKFFGDYVVNKHKKVSRMFAASGIHYVFTGHYHSQDITKMEWKDGSFIYDIETGSLVTYPCPVRKIEISENEMDISSQYITSIPSHPEGFSEYAREYVHSGVAGISTEVMVSMFIKRKDAEKLSSQVADAILAHYQGDELKPEKYLDLKGVGLLGRFIIQFRKGLIKGLYNDLSPADNEVVIGMASGETIQE